MCALWELRRDLRSVEGGEYYSEYLICSGIWIGFVWIEVLESLTYSAAVPDALWTVNL